MDLAKEAVRYAKLGLAVFPLAPGTKMPPKGTNGVKMATTNTEGFEINWKSHNIGVATGQVSGNIVVIDCDNDELSGKDGYGTVRAWEAEHGELPETWMALTPRGGYHYYYRLPSGVTFTNSANEDAAVDIRGDGGYVVAPPSRTKVGEYTWENSPDEYPMAIADDNVLDFIRSVRKGVVTEHGETYKLPRVIPEGRRHTELHKFTCSLIAKELDEDLILDAMRSANRKCVPPYSDSELLALYCDCINRYRPGLSDEAKETARRNKEAREAELEASEGIDLVVIDGMPSVWDGSRYQVGIRALDRQIIDALPKLSRSKRRDLREDMLLQADDVRAADARYIAFRNGVLDTDSGNMVEYTRDMHIVNVIPHDYIEGAESEVADRFLDDISCGNRETRQSVEEVIGLCMMRSCRYAKCPILLGSGSNGKSTFIRALRNVLGEENVSSLDLNILGERFQAQRIMGKLANIGDDISNERIPGNVAAQWKKMVTGERIYSDVKGSDGIEFTPYATLVFSANEMPSLGDSSEGMMRRLMPVPFEASFDDTNRDVDMESKLVTEEAASYLICRGVMAIAGMQLHGGVHESSHSKALTQRIKTDNNTVLQWVDAEDVTREKALDRECSSVYSDYSQCCQSNGVKAFSSNKFGRVFGTHFSLTNASVYDKCLGKKVRRYVEGA